jgi:hypothetical protein
MTELVSSFEFVDDDLFDKDDQVDLCLSKVHVNIRKQNKLKNKKNKKKKKLTNNLSISKSNEYLQIGQSFVHEREENIEIE